MEDAVELSNIYGQAAALYHSDQRFELASGFEARCLELWRHWDAKLPQNSFVRRELQAAGQP